MEQLIELDKQLLLFFNGYHTPFLDNFFWIFTSIKIWIPIALLIIAVIIKTKGKDAIWILLFLIMALILSDQISTLIKNLIERPRPTREISLDGLVQTVNGYLAGRYGFISSHASNSFAFALFTTLLFRHKAYTITIFIWAIINSYSRIYLGVHYPADIIGGIFLGLSLGGLFFLCIQKFTPQAIIPHKKFHYTKTGFSVISIYGILAGILLTVLTICLISL